MPISWSGVFPALTTKFTKDDKLDLFMFHKNLQAQLDAGVNGIILGGTLGEASVLGIEEKSALVKFAVEMQKVRYLSRLAVVGEEGERVLKIINDAISSRPGIGELFTN